MPDVSRSSFHALVTAVWCIGVGVCSSVIPYICDQLAMARLPRATFALLLSLLPASAAVIGAVVLHQIPTLTEVLVVRAVAADQERASE